MKKYLKLIIFVLIIFILLILNHIYGWSKYLTNFDNLLEIKKKISDNVLLASFIYIFITIIGCVVLALPGVTFAVFAGLLFGPLLGTIECLIATTLGAMLSYLASKYFLKDFVKPLILKNKFLSDLIFSGDKNKDITILMITRMIPIFPYNLQNFAYGISDVSFVTYSICTFVFMLPGVAAFTIGAAGISDSENRVKCFVIAIVLTIIVFIITLLIKKKYLSSNK